MLKVFDEGAWTNAPAALDALLVKVKQAREDWFETFAAILAREMRGMLDSELGMKAFGLPENREASLRLAARLREAKLGEEELSVVARLEELIRGASDRRQET